MAINEAPMAGSREDAVKVLRQRAMRLRIEADELDALANELPAEISKPAEKALWRITIGR